MSNQFQNSDDFLKLFNKQKEEEYFNVKEIPLKDLNKWSFKPQGYNQEYKESLVHDSGKFFSIEGIRVRTNYTYKLDNDLRYNDSNEIIEWDQPIINQPEIGILGILTKIFGSQRYYLMQGKMEPGNINILQLSPTVQATKSNFSQIHKGKAPPYLEYFINRHKSKIIIDQLQSEQGGRYIRKRNRNMVIETDEPIKVLPNFFWLTLKEIKDLLLIDNFVNMDARSVISTIPMESYKSGYNHSSRKEFNRWYIDQKVKYELEIEKIPLSNLDKWCVDDNSIFSNSRFFSVIGIKVETKSREISSWTQPIFKDKNLGLIGFLVKDIDGIRHFLVQTKVMPGNIDIIDLSPTISVSNYESLIKEEETGEEIPFMEFFCGQSRGKEIYNTIQSEEGGRFYQIQNRYMIVETDDESYGHLYIPDNYMWISYDQIKEFMPLGMFNIEARSLIATL